MTFTSNSDFSITTNSVMREVYEKTDPQLNLLYRINRYIDFQLTLHKFGNKKAIEKILTVDLILEPLAQFVINKKYQHFLTTEAENERIK